ncbi:PH (Pleckstrin Homology) domain-containing protein [Edaphobacter aggregans]|uniref:PH (Pleckstrin Homology) domain-containing protein n=2 Tax=Edaphobacter aggregans TaxID=570835 RepID=A0A3R9WJM4_9BACT|nr:PH (Pleckstrin Homology) domain-containing protein [Edaphobacter aggregans]
MRFYAQARLARISLPLLNLVACACQIQSTVRHPSTDHTLMAIFWGLITFLNAIAFWGTYWKVTPQGLLESRAMFLRRAIPYDIIQDVSPDDSPRGKQDNSRIRVSILLGKPLLVRPDEYERFVSALEQHLDPVLIHV